MDYEHGLLGKNDDMLPGMVQKISDNLSRIDLKIHNRYTKDDLSAVRTELREYLNNAQEMYTDLHLDQTKYPNEEEYGRIKGLCAKINPLLKKEKELFGEEKADCEETFHELFESYGQLIYSFQTASREIKNSDDMEVSANEIGMILLCKNVRIMEDLINKICSNNIDKSIIGGDKHFDSMRYGFEWLFCHNDISKNDSYKRIDIRDRNRYLDYIKYQIMVTGRYVDGAPKSSTDIDRYYLYIERAFDREKFDTKVPKITNFKKEVTKLIGEFFSVYELLIKYRDTLFREEEIRKELSRTVKIENPMEETISVAIVNLSSVAVRVLLDRFVSFVKISDLNFGNSTFNRSWFNYSELSSSNYAGSNFKYARIENAKVRNCDISTCNLSMADGGHTDFSYSNFNYSNLTGINLIDATVNHCEFQNAIFRDSNIDSYKEPIKFLWGDELRKDKQARKLISIWCSITDGNDPLRKIIDVFMNIELPELVKSEVEWVPWTILKYNFTGEDRRVFTRGVQELLKQYFERHISAELLFLVKDRLSWEREAAKNARIDEYGKVLLDVANLNNISAKYTQISDSDLCHVMMQNASFENADLSGTVMHYTNAQYTSFIQSNGNKIDCFESNFYSANFSNAVMNNALFLNCNLNRTNWNKAILIGGTFADFSGYVTDTIDEQPAENIRLQVDQYFDFSASDNEESKNIIDCPKYNYTSSVGNEVTSWQTDCGINDATFTNALADNTVFLGISADRSTFNNASFKNALFANCKMYLSDFIGADFRYANIILCCMGQSNFKNANITGAKISNVDFSGSNLSGALLNLSILNHILFGAADLHAMNLSGAQIRNSAFINCNIEGVIFAGAQFINCVFENIKFNNPIGIHSTTFKNCYAFKCEYDGGDIDDIELDIGIFNRDKK